MSSNYALFSGEWSEDLTPTEKQDSAPSKARMYDLSPAGDQAKSEQRSYFAHLERADSQKRRSEGKPRANLFGESIREKLIAKRKGDI